MTERNNSITEERPKLFRHLDICGFPSNRCDFTPKILRVRIVCSNGLNKKEIFGSVDPYCKLSLYKSIRSSSIVGKYAQTKTAKKTVNPCWNEEFLFRVNTDENRLVIEIYDENKLTRDDFLGIITIHLPQLTISTESSGVQLAPKSFKLRSRSSRNNVKGNLILYLAYIPNDVDPLTWTPSPEFEAMSGETTIQNDISLAQEEHSENDPLPPGWEERVDQNGRIYYVDHNNKRTQWERPTKHLKDRSSSSSSVATATEGISNLFDFSLLMYNPNRAPDNAVDTPVSPPITSVNESFEVNSSESSQQTTSSSSSLDSEDIHPNQINTETRNILPEGWEERTDLSGRVYYVDHITQKTQWEHPASKLGNAAPSFASAVATNPSNLVTNTTVQEDPAATMYLRRRQISHDDVATRNNATPRANNTPAVSLTPPTATAQAESIVVNGNTGAPTITAITPNNSPKPIPTPNPSQINAVAKTTGKKNNTTTTESEDELPPGWQMAMTPTGRRFFINHNDKTTTWEDPRIKKARSKSSNSAPLPNAINRTSSRDDLLYDLGPLPPGWEEREHSDGRIFYVNHNAKTTQWEDPRLSKFSGPAVPYSRNYKQKYDYFRSKLRSPKESSAKFEMRINRKSIFEDSYRLIYNVKKVEMLKYKLWIEFVGEKGLDYGGVQREWFFLLSREMFNPYYALFEYSAQDNYTLQINPLSGMANENHLRYFKFIGRVAGMAVYHGRLLDGFFIRPFYKMMLGKKISLKDMESVDIEYYRSLKFILENDPDTLELSFSVDEERYGVKQEIELIADGKTKRVTNENKRQYIECIINWRFVKRVEQQMSAFLEGFQDVIPLSTLQIFDANELELLLCGLQDINVSDWKSNTNYKGEYNINHPVIVNFWKAVYTFNNELRARLLQFVTGTSRVPMNGFVELWGSTGPQKFTIEKWGNPNQLPRAHTCFNRIDLPPYATFEELRRKLITAIENAEGFEGVD